MFQSKKSVNLFYKIYDLYRIDIYTKKLFFVSKRLLKNSKCQIKIFDLEKNKLYLRISNLRLITNLSGISQYSTDKSIYLCGFNKTSDHQSPDSMGSYLFRYDLENDFNQPTVLVNSIYVHYNPMMIILNDNIYVIGGKKQLFCEKYSISHNCWNKIPILPEERYKGSLLIDKKDSNLYLFGGTTNGKFNSSILFLNFRSIAGWETIIVKNQGNIIKRSSCIAFNFGNENDNNIFICGGNRDSNDCDDYVIVYQTMNKKIRKYYIKSELCKAKSKIQTVVEFDGKFTSFCDNQDNIYIIDNQNFQIRIIDTNNLDENSNIK